MQPIDEEYEIVERKGVGHPDTIADGIAELASIAYSTFCLEKFGIILHHNLDKVGVFGGLARFDWRNGHYTRPLRIVFGGRASTSFAGREIPVREILERAAHEYLRYALPGYEHVKIEFIHLTTDSSMLDRWFMPMTLDDLPEYKIPRANDTAYVVGAAPFTTAERIAFQCETILRRHDWAGSDIKALVVRRDRDFNITICVPALVGHFGSAMEYREALADTQVGLLNIIRSTFSVGDCNLVLNSRGGKPPDGAPPNAAYVNLTGSAIDYGEDGLVGRGNTRTGLIQPTRRHGNEAPFGKNPTYQVGKVCGYFVDTIAQRLATAGGACECAMTTRNGSPLNEPETLVITVTHPTDPELALRAASEALNEGNWAARIVSQRLYLPRLWEEQ
jgi:S-adenosylmethionine synthetase